MENVLQQKVVFQQIGNVNMEDFIADLLERIEKGEVEKENVEMQNQVLKQLNNRHKNINDAQRVMNKCLEIELAHLIKQE